MTPLSWQLQVFDQQKVVYSGSFQGPVLLGRQQSETEVVYTPTMADTIWRIPIAALQEDVVSRAHLLIEPISPGRFRLKNRSKHQHVVLTEHPVLEPMQTCVVNAPWSADVGPRSIRVSAAADSVDEGLLSLPMATMAPGQKSAPQSFRPSEKGVDPDSLIRWLRVATEVLHSATGSQEFFDRAAEAVVSMVGLDTGRVLLLEKGLWQIRAQFTTSGRDPDPNWKPSRRVLESVMRDRRTFWQAPQVREGSLVAVKAVVAAPILDRNGVVIGALYGDQHTAIGATHPLTRYEASLVEVLAGAVAAGLARLEQEQSVVRARVMLQQFFTRELYQELEARPELLEPRDADISVLFCDIRGFTRISERLGAMRTVEWIRDVLEELSSCVQAEQGVVSEYLGDELMAIWGAPVAIPDHAARACRAAIAMLDRLPALNRKWESILNEPLEIGVGINSGIARVGNIGTSQKYKYGPLGTAVNLASRVQGATKFLGTPFLITEATRSRLYDTTMPLRKLCKVRVHNIKESVTLFELGVDTSAWKRLRDDYETALQEFESGNFRTAVRILGNLTHEHPDDGPSLVLLSRIVPYMTRRAPGEFDPTWELASK